MSIAFAAGDGFEGAPLFLVLLYQFIAWFIILVPIVTFIFLSFLVIKSKKLLFVTSYIFIVVLIVADLAMAMYQFKNPNPIWMENLSGWLTIVVLPICFLALSFFVFKLTEGRIRKWFGYLLSSTTVISILLAIFVLWAMFIS